MKTKLILLLLWLCAICPLPAWGNYSITNDLENPFQLFYYTNSAGTYTSLSSNVPPGGNYVVSVSTNGTAGLGIEPTNATAFILVPWANMPVGSNTVSSFFTNALAMVAPPYELVPDSQLDLKSYFISGAVPSEANYWGLIDTLFWYVNAMYTNAVNASASSAAAANDNIYALKALIMVTNIQQIITNGTGVWAPTPTNYAFPIYSYNVSSLVVSNIYDYSGRNYELVMYINTMLPVQTNNLFSFGPYWSTNNTLGTNWLNYWATPSQYVVYIGNLITGSGQLGISFGE